ncbi:TonB-dependent receptor [Mesonia mobilis]|uniref:TonB-dependent receptor n=1 Tax=Mesonia mobilis TaxID=369791 RepID=A0ABQ3BZB5_9FLAO|nr:carboxypeptidase-like regulatory domain-containing protein [Mesonia mobilis]MBQ0736830.1 TonB-dependent receptor [Aquimarina celericrescens]GGZ58933.1 TonB-dependent receptor [Mesonia mobilis]
MRNFSFLLPLFLFISTYINAQEATIEGIILDENDVPVPGANISYTNGGTQTNENGYYELNFPANQEVVLTITYVGFKKIETTISPITANKKVELNFVLKTDVEQIGTVTITGNRNNRVEGITTISPETIRKIPGANAGVENLLKTLPGVTSNNELSSQYAVRGGNYDENLVYVNEIQVYRPFLIRSGQQEGLSFVNTDMVRNVEFSAGGFQAKYGDKLSSVLDITYRRPVDFGASLDLSLLGGSASIENVSENGKFSGIAGIRYRDNSLFVNAKETETNFRPRFADAQTYLTYQFSEKFELSFLGNIAINQYDYEPLTRQTNFGTISDPMALLIFYEGQEQDQYETYFGAFKATYEVSDNYTTKLIASAYNTQEQEYFDILAQYRLGEVNTDIGGENVGEVEFSEGVGSQLTHARNDLDALIFNLQHLGTITEEDHKIDYGIKYTHEDIRDRVREYEIIDSAGFSIRPPFDDFQNNQPYEPYDAQIAPYNNIRAFNETQINRFQAFAQWSYKTEIDSAEIYINAGARTHVWNISGENIESNTQQVTSVRGQLAWKPNWEKDMIFRLSGGLYYQPPFYRALRDSTGAVRPEVKAQKSTHIVLGNDYSFKLGGRPFTLVSEAYYKSITDVNPYTIENVRIRYRARNNAEAYAYGLDLRLNGEFVPGTESWVSFGYMKTEENIDDRGYIARPTDQRLKFAVLFQDYVPAIPALKFYLNMVYNTGLPGGSPSYADPYDYQTRLRDYRRADAGFSYVFADRNNQHPEGHWLNRFKELSIGFEIFNLFDNQNAITNTFVRDVYSQNLYSVPNYLSPRVFNLKLSMKF